MEREYIAVGVLVSASLLLQVFGKAFLAAQALTFASAFLTLALSLIAVYACLRVFLAAADYFDESRQSAWFLLTVGLWHSGFLAD